MQLKVYRQSIKERDGRIIYKGEDARPYVDNKCILVADGLGGASSIRHTKFDSRLFDENQIISIMFGDVFCENVDGCLVDYITDSFYEFLSLKDCYFDSIYNIKKSGYFASRIVSAIFLYEMKYNEIFSDTDKLFDIYDNVSDEEKSNYLKTIGSTLKETIQSKIKMVSHNAGLVYESSFTGLALLGTTLCATVFREKDNCVQALYFVAGDSRPYMWNINGLYQITPDQESEDGGMTNYIQATENRDFYIDCRYMEFSKPCILFNATDGCFDSTAFISPMAFEKLLLDSIIKSDDIGEVEQKLTEFFVENGKHDDSSTMALSTFGFESYEQLKETARSSADDLNNIFLIDMPELLEYDFSSELNNFRKDFVKDVGNIKTYLVNEFNLTDKLTGMDEVLHTEINYTTEGDLSEEQVVNTVNKILSNGSMQLTEEQKSKLTCFIDIFNELKRLEKICNVQQELFSKYNKIYYSLIK